MTLGQIVGARKVFRFRNLTFDTFKEAVKYATLKEGMYGQRSIRVEWRVGK